MTAQRETLPMRRPREGFDFDHSGIRYTACVGWFADDRIAEIFLSTTKAGSDADAIAQDAALLFSLAVQYGCPLSTIRSALSRDNRGHATGALGHAIELIREVPRDERSEVMSWPR
jgi:hypothetical protein